MRISIISFYIAFIIVLTYNINVKKKDFEFVMIYLGMGILGLIVLVAFWLAPE